MKIEHPEIDLAGEQGKGQYFSGITGLYSRKGKEPKILVNFLNPKEAGVVLNHEFMHHLLYKMFGDEVSRQFDTSGLSQYLDCYLFPDDYHYENRNPNSTKVFQVQKEEYDFE